jgi:hypothetical protein
MALYRENDTTVDEDIGRTIRQLMRTRWRLDERKRFKPKMFLKPFTAAAVPESALRCRASATCKSLALAARLCAKHFDSYTLRALPELANGAMAWNVVTRKRVQTTT